MHTIILLFWPLPRHRRKRYHRCLCVLFLWFFLYCIGTLAKANNFRASFRPNVGGGLTSRPCSGSGNPDGSGNPNGSGQSTTDGNIANNGNNGDGDSYEKDIKTKILQSSLPHVPRHGWSRDTVAAGIQIFSIIIFLLQRSHRYVIKKKKKLKFEMSVGYKT